MNAKRTIRLFFAALAAIGMLHQAPTLALAKDKSSTPASTTLLKPGDRLAIVGDSITELKGYSRFLETYLTACTPELDLRIMQYGWSGETAPLFLARMHNDLSPFKPSVVTICYGMNDGGYQLYSPEIGKKYEGAMRTILTGLKGAGATVLVGSPGAVDPRYFPPSWLPCPLKDGNVYNENLGHLRDIARAQAAQAGMPFTDIHDPLIQAMKAFKAAQGSDALVAGADSIHPSDNGHLLMAYAFLKGLGVSGDIGTITVDMRGSASATPGHRVISADRGRVELESTRYPFCFSKINSTDGTEKSSTRSMLPFIPFNQDLNRLTLVVRRLRSKYGTVTWGGQSKTFPRKQLAQGVNLAAEFLDNPFLASFERLDQAVQAKQTFETFMIKGVMTNFRTVPDWLAADEGVRDSLKQTQNALQAEDDRLSQKVRAAATPVRHTITITESAGKQ